MASNDIRSASANRATEISPKQRGGVNPAAVKSGSSKVEVVVPPIQAQSALSMQLAELNDGDASEAIAMAASGQGQRNGSAKGSDEAPKIDEVQAKPKLQRRHNPAQTNAEKSDDKTEVTKETSSIELSTQKSQDIRSSHKQLMAVTQTMNRKDLGTFMAQKDVDRLIGILSKDQWQTKVNASEELTGLQVAKAAPAA